MKPTWVSVDLTMMLRAARELEALAGDLTSRRAASPVLDPPEGILDVEGPRRLWLWLQATEVAAAAVARQFAATLLLRELGLRVQVAARLYAAREEAVRLMLRRLTDQAREVGLLREAPRMPALVEQPPGQAPTDLGSALEEINALGSTKDGQIRVIGQPQADGSMTWTVLIPGTQSWDPRAGDNPMDLTTNIAAMSDQVTLLAAGVAGALGAAQASAGRDGRGDEVLLVGHSQGGIIAAGLAADPGFRARFSVSHVVTAGSPIALIDVPREVSVVSLEHDGDIVPALDTADNPWRAGWVTVKGPAPIGTVSAHDCGAYATTMRASLRDGLFDRGGVRRFFSGTGPPVVRQVRVERAWQNPRS